MIKGEKIPPCEKGSFYFTKIYTRLDLTIKNFFVYQIAMLEP